MGDGKKVVTKWVVANWMKQWIQEDKERRFRACDVNGGCQGHSRSAISAVLHEMKLAGVIVWEKQTVSYQVCCEEKLTTGWQPRPRPTRCRSLEPSGYKPVNPKPVAKKSSVATIRNKFLSVTQDLIRRVDLLEKQLLQKEKEIKVLKHENSRLESDNRGLYRDFINATGQIERKIRTIPSGACVMHSTT